MPVALITGAKSQIGEGIAAALLDAGWQVVLTDIDVQGAQAVAARLDSKDVTVFEMDVTHPSRVEGVVEHILTERGSLDGFVNVAGGLRGLGVRKKPFIESTPEEWRKVLDVNLYGTLITCRAVLPAMISKGRGAIVLISSSRGLRGGAGTSIYSAAKAGVILFAQCMAQDCAAHGIRINTVAPGNTAAVWKSSEAGSRQPPLGRPASGRDIGDAVAFLLSDRASHITGACLDVSGGMALH